MIGFLIAMVIGTCICFGWSYLKDIEAHRKLDRLRYLREECPSLYREMQKEGKEGVELAKHEWFDNVLTLEQMEKDGYSDEDVTLMREQLEKEFNDKWMDTIVEYRKNLHEEE